MHGRCVAAYGQCARCFAVLGQDQSMRRVRDGQGDVGRAVRPATTASPTPQQSGRVGRLASLHSLARHGTACSSAPTVDRSGNLRRSLLSSAITRGGGQAADGQAVTPKSWVPQNSTTSRSPIASPDRCRPSSTSASAPWPPAVSAGSSGCTPRRAGPASTPSTT